MRERKGAQKGGRRRDGQLKAGEGTSPSKGHNERTSYGGKECGKK